MMIQEMEMIKEDKPLTITKSLSFINSYIYNSNRFIIDNRLTNQSFDLLLTMVNYYSLTNKAMSCTQLLKESSFNGKYYQKIYSMLNTLYSNGMVEYIGNGWNNCKLFAPTDKAINSINDLVASIKV